MRTGIIGTAGRREDGPKMSKELFTRMCSGVWNILLTDEFPSFEEIILVSGGAAWADHVAVRLFKMSKIVRRPFAGLELYLPTDIEGNQFIGGSDARTANYYHQLFSQKMGYNTIEELSNLRGASGVSFFCGGGFKARNLSVANNVDYLFAMTWGPGAAPKDGGTAHTWRACRAPKRHLSLTQI